MRIAVLSGKGGTGKTFVSTNLASIVNGSVYVDCDVEEPNGKLFFKCSDFKEKTVTRLLPEFLSDKCCGCRKCVDFCKFNALAFVGGAVRLFDEVCHSCRGCFLVCGEGAISEKNVAVGRLEEGIYGGTTVICGEMNIGEASGVPIIREAIRCAFSKNAPLTVIDCPPGSACTVTESIVMADCCVLVAEPTVFGLHNLKMVLELAQKLSKPCFLLINKYDGEFLPLEELCRESGLPVVARIPFKKQYAESISEGVILSEKDPEIREIFVHLLESMGVSCDN